jgi:hypothetical protein
VDNFGARANAVRDLPLEVVLDLRGAVRDANDRSKWHTERGPVSVSGQQFMNWRLECGGGGAIDLLMHLASIECREAVVWLEQYAGGGCPLSTSGTQRPSPKSLTGQRTRPSLRLPPRSDQMLGRVGNYLTARRHLDPLLISRLMACGRLYADARGNAVFVLMAGKPNRPVGAEMRGTGAQAWRGMAPGSSKDVGFFWMGPESSLHIILCESAIDAISCYQMYPDRICISTSGVRANPPWLKSLIARGHHIHCGFDTDAAGETTAARMLDMHPSVDRLRPPAHDWNDALALRG